MARSPLARARRAAGDYALAKALFGLTGAVGALPIDRALDLADKIGVRLGPRASRHRLVLENLRLALPELSENERAAIGRSMWGHQARLIVEAAFPKRLFDFAPARPTGRVEVRSAIDLAARRAEGRTTLFFTAHTGCFEFLPAAARALDFPMATLFRAPNNRHIADRLLEQRRDLNGLLVPAGRGAAATLARELAEGRAVGVLVDQKFLLGPAVPFFDRLAPTNPLVAKLARYTSGEVVPVRCVRLPGHRYRIEIEQPLTLPANDGGETDVPVGLAAVNAKVEEWVREHPEQWMWFHRRWG